ncbi:EamA family transporter [Kushneria indalinina]|uniref:EamA-like transporter family protein n=1 Tax=Kushneria indalinina DSM 14324 TaxID=1122140 RepID=A0A3D9E2A7_9GAMM|nr:EamA family transporter [Kushneria indalinina]REC96574.1 EamA-like transporter family protein [Kushneria indalinina DSM 14324]
MSPEVFAIVLCGAALHAGWNALVRVGLDRLLAVTLIQIGGGVLALGLLPLVSVPGAAAWPWLALSAVLHVGYNVFLARAYASGDFGQVYPIARGSAPLIVALVGLMALGDQPSLVGYSGVVLLSGGIWWMAVRGAGVTRLPRTGLVSALITSVFIASYTLSDGLGARANHDAIGYILWLFALNGLCMGLLLWAMRGRRTLAAIAGHYRVGLAGGAMSMAAYGATIWAMSQAPIAMVAALRESSVLFALAISALFLGERLSRQRLVAGLIILIGVVVLRLG